MALLIRLREQGKPLPALAVCLSPGTDFSMWGESWTFNKGKDFMLDQRNIQKSIDIYLRDVDRRSPLVSPVYGDLQGLPPILVQVGSDEVLLTDATRFVEKAKAAGVPATLEVWEGMQHVWQYTASFLPEARSAIHNIGEFAEKFWAV